MLLTRKISTSDKGTTYPKNGITSELYKLIYNKVIQFDRKNGWTLRDVVISKTTADNAGRTEDTYEVQDCIEKLAVAQLRKIPLEYPYDRAVEGPLTEEELAYKTFNLNFHYAPISYGSVLRNFENRIRTVDRELNRRYMELLLDYAQIEKQEKEKKKAEWEAKKNLTHHELSTETGEEAEADKVPF
ncbi:MAG TPA: hypothetical protein PKK94_27925, partial [Leptospiraceae bacterium]|nr:hypothetical protein [Leptospiraceae bacterium]